MNNNIFPQKVREWIQSVTLETKPKSFFKEESNQKILDPNNLTPEQNEQLLLAMTVGNKPKRALAPKTSETRDEQKGYEEPRFMSIQDRVKENNHRFLNK